MKLTALMLLLFCLSLSAETSSQTVTFSGKNVPLDRVLSVIEKQTGYVVIGSASGISNAERITLDVKNMELQSFLNLVFGPSFDFEIRSKTIFVKEKPAARARLFDVENLFVTKEIGGFVQDGGRKPLAGATVKVKGKPVSTVTTDRGAFNIRAELGDVLEVSFCWLSHCGGQDYHRIHGDNTSS